MIYIWRKKWNIGWLEAMHTPLQAIYNDFEMGDIEADHATMRAAAKKEDKQDNQDVA